MWDFVAPRDTEFTAHRYYLLRFVLLYFPVAQNARHRLLILWFLPSQVFGRGVRPTQYCQMIVSSAATRTPALATAATAAANARTGCSGGYARSVGTPAAGETRHGLDCDHSNGDRTCNLCARKNRECACFQKRLDDGHPTQVPQPRAVAERQRSAANQQSLGAT